MSAEPHALTEIRKEMEGYIHTEGRTFHGITLTVNQWVDLLNIDDELTRLRASLADHKRWLDAVMYGIRPRIDLCNQYRGLSSTVRQMSPVWLKRVAWRVRRHPKLAQKDGVSLAWLHEGPYGLYWTYSAPPWPSEMRPSVRKVVQNLMRKERNAR